MADQPTVDNSSDRKSLHTILVVEDDEAICDFLQQAISSETPHAVLMANDAAQALQAVKTIIPSLLILDYHLPDTNGLELFDRLHAIKNFEAVPAMMISSTRLNSKELQERQITFLRKPFELTKFLQVIDRLLPPPDG